MGAVVWTANEGYFSNQNLSKELRYALMPETKFRQLAKIEKAVGKNKGEKFMWNIYSKVDAKGGQLSTENTIPETGFTVTQGELIITQFGNSIPYGGKVRTLSEHNIKEIINEVLKEDAKEAMDDSAAEQFDQTPLRVVPTGGTSTTNVTLTTNGTPAAPNNAAMTRAHVKTIANTMKERNIPRWKGNDYGAIGRPTTFEGLTAELEDVYKYVPEGHGKIVAGELGRYGGVRFIEQTNIAADTTNFALGASDWCYFFGSRPIVEGVAVPEEIRAKIPIHYGLDEGLAWYYLGGFAIEFPYAANARIVKWDSAPA